jgi:hypothetical protein
MKRRIQLLATAILVMTFVSASCQASRDLVEEEGLTEEEKEAYAVELVRQRVNPVISANETSRNLFVQESNQTLWDMGIESDMEGMSYSIT